MRRFARKGKPGGGAQNLTSTPIAPYRLHMPQYPLFLTTRVPVSGDGFAALVTVQGKLVAVFEAETGEWWMYGVQPGALAEGAPTIQEAFVRYCDAFQTLLREWAAATPTLEQLETRVRAFFDQIDTEEEARWERAVQAIRKGAEPEKTLATLPKWNAETPTFIQVERVDQSLAISAITQPQQQLAAA